MNFFNQTETIKTILNLGEGQIKIKYPNGKDLQTLKDIIENYSFKEQKDEETIIDNLTIPIGVFIEDILPLVTDLNIPKLSFEQLNMYDQEPPYWFKKVFIEVQQIINEIRQIMREEREIELQKLNEIYNNINEMLKIVELSDKNADLLNINRLEEGLNKAEKLVKKTGDKKAILEIMKAKEQLKKQFKNNQDNKNAQQNNQNTNTKLTKVKNNNVHVIQQTNDNEKNDSNFDKSISLTKNERRKRIKRNR